MISIRYKTSVGREPLRSGVLGPFLQGNSDVNQETTDVSVTAWMQKQATARRSEADRQNVKSVLH
jgi:hypothetical protein